MKEGLGFSLCWEWCVESRSSTATKTGKAKMAIESIPPAIDLAGIWNLGLLRSQYIEFGSSDNFIYTDTDC